MKKFGLGAYFMDLSPENRIKLERNKGVQITLVVKGTPAFNENVLVGDVILKMNEQEVVDSRDFRDKLIAHSGEAVSFGICRNGAMKTVSVRLNK